MPHGGQHPEGAVSTPGLNVFEPLKTPKQKCEDRGWVWDEETQTCTDPNKPEPTEEPTQTPQPPVAAPALETFTDPNTGRATGITTPDGRTFLGLSPDEVSQVAQQQGDIQARPEGTAAVGTAQAQAIEQQRIQQLVSQIGQLGNLSATQQADINLSQAATAGAFGVIPGRLGGAAAGAIGGAAVGGVGAIPGAIGGAILGTIGGFTSGIISNVKEQQRGELQAADIELTNARTNMRQLAMLASQDPANADIYIQQYNQQLTRIHQARRQTKAEVSGDLNAWIEDGREQLADFDAFLQAGGIADIYGQKLAIALSSGVPLSINGEELLI